MKAVILAGGAGTRLVEETSIRPKPMVEIGGRPILWHIMKIYSTAGINDFIICCGYKGSVIKEYFANYFLYMSDVTFDMRHNRTQVHRHSADPWKVTVVDTGTETMTGGRLKRIRGYLGGEDFCMTYGDGVADIDVRALVAFHKKKKARATVTSVRPPARFGTLELDGDGHVKRFREKPPREGWINGGFFVLSPKAVDYIEGDATVWEGAPLERLAREGQLASYRHEGFWHPMDTQRDKNHLEALWQSGKAPWKLWK